MSSVAFLKNAGKLRQILKTKTKRKLIAILVIVISIVLGHIFFLASWVSAIFVTRLLSGKGTGKRGIVPSIKLPLGKYVIHLHHWFISAGVMLFALLKGGVFIPAQLFYGIGAGILFQGIYSYKDWYKVLLKRARPPEDTSIVQQEEAPVVSPVEVPSEQALPDEGGPTDSPV